ncbi:sugar-binding transcriptional regulator [Natronospora cellulosivora (SeqCode)]
MEYLFKIQGKIVPELITVVENRYTILRNVYYQQPIGRRALSEKTLLSERTVRRELDFLHGRGLVNISRSGAMITKTGSEFLPELDKYIKEIKGIKTLESKIEKILGLEKVYIVPGNLEHSTIIQEIGRFTARLVKKMLKDGDVLAVTGGSTLAHIAKAMHTSDKTKDITVVPGRGGLGEEVEIQANTISSTIAKKLGGRYQLLHIPDSIKTENVDIIIAEPSIQRVLKTLKKTNILLHGVGSAEEMAKRRDMSEEQITKLMNKGAVAEALGYYFDKNGKIVYTTTSVGLHLEDLQEIEKVIIVAGAPAKAEAIVSVVSPKYHDLLITDELTAKEILTLRG